MPANPNPFAARRLNRFFGGTNAQRDPYVSGFFLIQFRSLPQDMIPDDSGKILTAVCTAVTLPDYSLDKVTVNALGGLKFHVPGALTIGETCSLTFTEYQYLPVFNTIRDWSHAIRNNILGFSNHDSLVGTDAYVQNKYKAGLLVAYCRPNMQEVEFYAYLSGVWPLKVPTDGLNAEIATVEKKDLTVDFSVDLLHLDEWVKQECQNMVDDIRGSDINNIINLDNFTIGGQS